MKRVDPGRGEGGGQGGSRAGGGRKPSLKGSRLSAIPMEWMDPMSWRLPSGKALAEFALQAGFLAPLMLSGPQLKRKKIPVAPLAGGAENSAVRVQVVRSQVVRSQVAGSPVVGSQVGEEPDPSGSFRGTGPFRGTR
jgi:hypothetical protein